MGKLIIGQLPTMGDESDVRFSYLDELTIDDDDVDMEMLVDAILDKLDVEDSRTVTITVPDEVVSPDDGEDLTIVLAAEEADEPAIPAEEVLATAATQLVDSLTTAVDTATLLAATSEQEDTASQDSLSTLHLSVQAVEELDPFDPVVTVAEGDSETILVRGGTDVIDGIVTRVNSRGSITAKDVPTAETPTTLPPLTAGVEDALSALTTVLARVASTQAQDVVSGAEGDVQDPTKQTGTISLTGPSGTTTTTTTLSKTEDAADGHTLTENGSPADRSSPASKFDEGYDMDGSDDSLTNGDNGLSESGDFAVSFAFEVDAYPSSGEETVAVVQEDTGDPYWKALVDASQDLVFDAGPFGVGSLGSLGSTGFFSAWVKRSVSSVALSKTEDAANNHPLTENGTPPNDTSADAKYGEGYDLSASGDYLSQGDAALEISGDLSLTVSFEVNNLPSASAVLLYHGVAADETESGNVLYMIRVQSDGTIRYLHESGAGNNTLVDSTNTIGTGSHTLTIQRDTVNKQLTIKVDGTTFIDTTYSNNPSGGSSGDLYIGARSDGADEIDGDVHELRVWSQLVGTTDPSDTDTLSKIADPSNRGASGFEKRTEGNEVACWFMGDDEETSTVQAKVYDSSGNVVFNNTKDRNQPSLDGTANIDLGAAQLDGGLYEVRYWLSGNVPSTSTLDNIADPTVTGSTGHEQRLEGNEEAVWFLGDDLITETSGSGSGGDSATSVPTPNANLDVPEQATGVIQQPPSPSPITPVEPGNVYDLFLAHDLLPAPADGDNRIDAALVQDTVSETDTQTPTADFYAALQDLTNGASAAGVPDGNLDQVTFDSTRGQGSIMVGEADTANLPDRDLDSILFRYIQTDILTNDVVNVKWELPPPNFVDNWHFADGVTTSGWSVVDGTTTIAFNHDVNDGFRSVGCLAIDSGSSETDRDQLHQRVTGLSTGAGRKVTVKLQHFSTDTGITAHDVRLRIYADSSGTKGAELANVQLSGDDGTWTQYTLEGDSSGTLDFSIGDNVSALWVEIDANDQDGLSTINRRIDDVRCEVTGLGETVISEQTVTTYPTDGDAMIHARKLTMEAFPDGGDPLNWGWRSGGSSHDEISVQFSSAQAADGSLSLEFNRSTAELGGRSESIQYESLTKFSEGVFAVRLRVDSIGEPAFFEVHGASNDGFEVVLDAGNDLKVQDTGSNNSLILDSNPSIDQWYTVILSVVGDQVTAVGYEGTDSNGTFLDSGTITSAVSSYDIVQQSVTFTDAGSTAWFDVLGSPFVDVADVSSHNISRSEVDRLLAWVEHVDGGDGVNNALVESIGLRYT